MPSDLTRDLEACRLAYKTWDDIRANARSPLVDFILSEEPEKDTDTSGVPEFPVWRYLP